MYFTDDDLKWLKEQIETCDEMGHSGFMGISPSQVDSILARLEAAEKHISDCVEFHGIDDNDSLSYEAWRKAAGKSHSD